MMGQERVYPQQDLLAFGDKQLQRLEPNRAEITNLLQLLLNECVASLAPKAKEEADDE
jgi:hypothetical protein